MLGEYVDRDIITDLPWYVHLVRVFLPLGLAAVSHECTLEEDAKAESAKQHQLRAWPNHNNHVDQT